MMNKLLIVMAFSAIGLPLFAQADAHHRLAPGAEGQLAALLNKPAMVKPAMAVPLQTPLGKNWFTLETEAHVFTDQVSYKQVIAALIDIENYGAFFNGDKSKLTSGNVSRGDNEIIADFVSTAVVPVVKIQLRTPYRASVKTVLNTETRFAVDIRQTTQDNTSNIKIKNLYAPRYVEEVTINGKKYVYIRSYTINDVDASILPGAKGTLEKNAGPVNEEALTLLIAAAKTK